MASSIKLFLFSILVLGGINVLLAQMAPNSVSSIIRYCYKNVTAYDRYKRQPMHIGNLVSIIRKLEQKTDYNWDMRKLARTIVKSYQYDGMEFHQEKHEEYAFSQWPLESLKSQIIHEMIPAPDVFPDGALDNDEMCALHWMMSQSMNATMRDDEVPDRYGQFYKGELRAKRETDDDDDTSNEDEDDVGINFFDGVGPDGSPHRKKRAAVALKDKQTTNRPLETGVVYTKWGAVSAGRLIAGIAAGLEPQEKPVVYIPISSASVGGPQGPNSGSYPLPPSNGGGSNTGGGYYPNPNNNNNNNGNNNWQSGGWSNGRKKRQIISNLQFVNIKNLFAATLGGDIGQAAILNAPNQLDNVSPPSGEWNDTVCPREYILSALPNPDADAHHDHDTWTYMTVAEIRGGIDGFVIGSKIQSWDKGTTSAGLRLSQVLETYYSEDGVSSDPTYRACDRFPLFQGTPEQNELREQARSFAYEFNRRVQKITIFDDKTGTFLELVEKALAKMQSFGSNRDPPCVRRPTPVGGSVEIPDNDKFTEIKSNVYVVMDGSVGNFIEYKQQQRFVAQLAHDLQVSPTGSRLGIVDGGTGMIMIKPNDTDNGALLACRILDQPQFIRNQDLPQSLRSIRTEIERVREIDRRNNAMLPVGRATNILVLVQGNKIDEGRKDEIRDILNDFNNHLGDVHTVFVSSKYNQQDFEHFSGSNDGFNFIKLRGSQNMSDDSTEFTKEFVKRSSALLTYPKCDDRIYSHEQESEYAEAHNIFVTPGTIQYFKVSPDDFFSSVDMRFRFTSEYGKARVCVSRDERMPNTRTNSDCRETSGNYDAPGGSGRDLEFEFIKPCKRKREGCKPVYLSITTTTNTPNSLAQNDCSTYGCEKPNQLKVTWSHYGMRCLSGSMSLTSSLGMVMAAILSLLYINKSV